MTIRYAPPLTSAPVDSRQLLEAVLEGPAYIRGPRSTRWHRVRSSYLWMVDYMPDKLRQRWEFWCGPGMSDWHYDPWLTDEPPASEPRCGTCEGRYAGTQSGTGLLFTPHTLTPPRWCPSSGGLALVRETAYNRADCLVCGEHVKLRATGGPYNGGFGAGNHHPGPGLIPGCEFHAWKQLTRRGDVVVCRCQ